MDVVIFAGGFGTRLSEETHLVPKPMIEIGGVPILVHIMQLYASYGHENFVICGGYKVDYIKNFFSNYMRNMNDLKLNFADNSIQFLAEQSMSWTVKIIDTGLETNTAGRLKRVAAHIESDEFFVTYGDGVSNVNLDELYTQHKRNGTAATLSAVVPNSRFGALKLDGSKVREFTEKPTENVSRINGGFMVVSRPVLDLITKDSESFEEDILPLVAKEGDLGCYFHDGFWHPMDTLRDKKFLENLWDEGRAPWRT